uniref:Fibronectin type III and ankyrin repeat domains 1 n=1 Tax=Rattus norvegicus TaxID=10116 RepID=A0ABK0LPH9_RAT
MEPKKIVPLLRPHPPVVGKVTHHSIELYWDLEKREKRQGPQEQWLRFSIEEEDPKMHNYGVIYTGYATKHVVEGLEPRTLYRFRLKVTSPSGEYEYSPVVSVATTREPISSEHFHRAVNVNDEDLLLRILEGGHVMVDVPNKFGFTALMVAAQKGYTRLVKILISNGTDVNLKNGSGKDSLMLACYAGHLDVVKYLRKHGASWDARDLGGCTALHWAADGGHCPVIDWMIKDGCEALSAMSFPLSTAFIVSHKFGYVVPSFSLNFKKFFISFFISSLTRLSLSRALFNFHVYVGILPLLLLKTSFRPWWSDSTHGIISIFLYLLRPVF